ncbi:alpha/beta hydrolase [Candidatus Methylocalor cossyra]|uniref:alpha/beta hydrolase n=1 Tax=Candidatus Methylocalor cossyra TaxID=3108543 RepID=UPI0032B30A26
MLWRSLALIAFWGLCPTASARRVDAALYPYPYQDPYLASTTVAILKDRDQRYVWSEAQALELELIPGRNQVPLLEGKGKLHTRYLPQPGPAPLIVLLPGFGGSAYSGSARYVAQLFQDHGFQVLSLPSPFHWNFALAASRSALPGLTERDSAELYRAIQAALDQIRRRYHAEITTIGLIGLSHGALVAGYLSKLDAEERRVGFGTTLLVNPPIDLLTTLRTIDRLADAERRFPAAARANLQAYAFGVGKAALDRDIDDPSYFAHWNQRLRLSGEEIRYLIGWVLREPVGESLYVAELVRPLGILRTPISWGYRSARLDEARSFGLMDYLRRVLIPKLNGGPAGGPDLEHWLQRSSLKNLASFLREQRTVYLMHNADDFLVSRDDLAYAERVFGERAIIYPLGGHLGNLWYPQNRRDMLEVMQRPVTTAPARPRP